MCGSSFRKVLTKIPRIDQVIEVPVSNAGWASASFEVDEHSRERFENDIAVLAIAEECPGLVALLALHDDGRASFFPCRIMREERRNSHTMRRVFEFSRNSLQSSQWQWALQ